MILCKLNFIVRNITNSALKPSKNIKSDQYNSLLSQYMLKVKSKKVRLQHNLIALEGKRLINDALSAGVCPEAVFYSSPDLIEDLNLDRERSKLQRVSYKQMKLWSNLVTAPGIIAFANISNFEVKECNSALPVTLICDEVRDPGNLGSILRSAAAAPVSRVVLSKGCVDPWDSKVLRGGSGAHFRVPLDSGLSWEEIKSLVGPSDSILVADSSDYMSSAEYTDVEFNHDLNHTFLILGGEIGLSQEAVSSFDSKRLHRIHIPLDNDIESLNSAVAFSIIIFEFKKRFKKCEIL